MSLEKKLFETLNVKFCKKKSLTKIENKKLEGPKIEDIFLEKLKLEKLIYKRN